MNSDAVRRSQAGLGHRSVGSQWRRSHKIAKHWGLMSQTANQVECWFSILSRAALRGASFTSARQLREAIDKFVRTYNADAAPFEWTKAVVHPTAPKRIYADLCK